MIRTTIGRIVFNTAFPEDFEFRNEPVLKPDVGRIVDEVVHRYDRAQVEIVLDNLKNLGFHYATRAGVTIGGRGRHHPDGEAEDPRRAREACAEGRAAVPQGHHHRR